MSQAARSADGSSAQATRQEILRAYRERTPRSAAMFERARQSLVGGTAGNLRYFPPYPLYFTGGIGSCMKDVDGNEYVDCFLCNGPLLLGHRHPRVMEAIANEARVGSLVVNPELAVAAAEQVQRTVPSAERVRFLNSGTEAVMAAVRLARAHTLAGLLGVAEQRFHSKWSSALIRDDLRDLTDVRAFSRDPEDPWQLSKGNLDSYTGKEPDEDGPGQEI